VTPVQDLLRRADAAYRSVQAARPERVPCRRGCRDCCLGLFDVTLADRDLLREGLAASAPEVRADIEARASAVVRSHGLGETLAGWSEERIDALCDAAGDVACPVLGPEGECRLYEHRPLTCRLSGIPLVDLSGEVVLPEGCSKCTLTAAEAPRIDCASLRRDEEQLLRERYGAESGTTLFIAQAVAPRG
jgi:Fe-S-cluster containining protein